MNRTPFHSKIRGVMEHGNSDREFIGTILGIEHGPFGDLRYLVSDDYPEIKYINEREEKQRDCNENKKVNISRRASAQIEGFEISYDDQRVHNDYSRSGDVIVATLRKQYFKSLSELEGFLKNVNSLISELREKGELREQHK